MKVVKTIKINPDKCCGCRACEVACSVQHAEPQFGAANPKRARIQIFKDEENDLYVPLIAGVYTDVECPGRHTISIKGKEYGECSFCRSACPSRSLFREPDTDTPLKCDMCGEPMPEGGPVCVKWCKTEALKYQERVEEEGS